MELRHYASILWRWAWLIALCVVAAAAAGFVASGAQPRVYESSTRLLVNQAKSLDSVAYQDILTSVLLFAMLGLIVAAERLSGGLEPRITLTIADSAAAGVAPTPLSDSPDSSSPRLIGSVFLGFRVAFRYALETLWWTYWAVAVLLVVLAFVVESISVAGWIP